MVNRWNPLYCAWSICDVWSRYLWGSEIPLEEMCQRGLFDGTAEMRALNLLNSKAMANRWVLSLVRLIYWSRLGVVYAGSKNPSEKTVPAKNARRNDWDEGF